MPHRAIARKPAYTIARGGASISIDPAGKLTLPPSGDPLMHNFLSTFCVATIFVCLSALPAYATEWFVAPGGTGNGTSGAPFGRIQDGLNAAQAGDVVTVATGVYTESIRTVRSGSAGARIHLRAQGPRGTVVVTASANVLRVDHAHITVEGLILDGQYAAADTVDVNSTAHFLTLRNLEVRRSTKDLIDIGNPQGVLIEQCLIHHALNAAGGRTDAHGIVASAVRNLTIRDTDIHTFSGDGFQVDSGTLAPGWSDVTVERTRIWLEPLPAPQNGFPAGAVPGENAIDTKAASSLPRSVMTIRDVDRMGIPRRVHRQHGGVQPEGKRRGRRRPRDGLRLGDWISAARARIGRGGGSVGVDQERRRLRC